MLARQKIRIVLCNPTHPGNIGAAARAMKTMGLERLLLVAPRRYPCAEATARAAGADDILAACRVCPDLESALAGAGLVAATTARTRSIRWPERTPAAAAEVLIEKARRGREVAVVFGPESSGLSNAQLDLCNFMIRIPAAPEFSSLNLAAAVQVVCYELRRCFVGGEAVGGEADGAGVSAAEMERFYRRLEGTLLRVGYLDAGNPGKLMRRLRRLFNRVEMDEEEYHILMGVLTAVEKRFSELGLGSEAGRRG